MSTPTTARDMVEMELPATCRIPHFATTLANGVKVIIVQDKEATISSAAMNIKVGCNNDPPELPGLAHLCEHMLFLGTEKYPEEGEYDRYISRNGGHDNAWTSSNGTNFYFTVNSDAFEGALDRFVQFFVSPTFSESGLEREVQAVHSEDEKNHNNDYWRGDEIARMTARDDHPRFRYGNGNIKTLWNEPRAKGIDVRAKLLEFYQRYYVAEAACICIYSQYDVESILKVVEPALGHMRSDPKSVASNSFLGPDVNPISNERGLAQWYNIKAVRNSVQQISLKFPVPYSLSNDEFGIPCYAMHIIGHECDCSVLGVLKSLGFAEEMTAGCSGHAIDDDWDYFTMNVQLTKKGVENMVEVIDLLFEAVELLRRINNGEADDAAFKDMLDVYRLNFNMEECGQAHDHAGKLSSGGNLHGLKRAWSGDRLIVNPDKERATEILKYLVPSNCTFAFVWAGHPLPEGAEEEAANDDDEEEEEEEATPASQAASPLQPSHEFPSYVPAFAQQPLSLKMEHHHTPYSVFPVPADLMERWSTGITNKKELHSGLALPTPNPFVTTDFSIASPGASKYPTELKGATSFGKVWHKLDDDRFKVPKAFLRFQMESPACYKSPINRYYTRVAVRMLKQLSTEIAYFATLGGIENTTTPAALGFEFTTSGPTGKIFDFVGSFVFQMLSAETYTTFETVFSNNAARVQRELEGMLTAQPYHLIQEMLNCAVYDFRWQVEEIIAASKTPEANSFEGFKAFIAEMLTEMRYDMLITGNVTEKDALEFVKELDEKVIETKEIKPIANADASLQPVRDVVALQPLAKVEDALPFLQIPALNPKDDNSAVMLSFQLGPKTPRTRNLTGLTAKFLSSLFFNALRTTESLGYIVYCGARVMEDGINMQFVAQSAEHAPPYLLSRIYAFIEAAREQVFGEAAFTDEEMAQVVAAEEANLKNFSKSIPEEGMMHYGRRRHPIGFHIEDVLLEDLPKITKAEIKEFFETFIAEGGAKRAPFASTIYGKKYEPEFLKADDGGLSGVVEYTFPAKVKDKSEEEGAEKPKIVLNKYREEDKKKKVVLRLLERDAASLKAFRESQGGEFLKFPKDLVQNPCY